MNVIYKFWLSVLIAITLVTLCVYLLVLTNHTLNTSATTNTIAFSGEGKIIAKPDIAKISFSIVTEGDTSKAAQDSNSAKSKAVIDYLKKQNIADGDITTSSYNINPKYDYRNGGSPVINGYQVNETVDVKIRDLTKVNSIVSGLVGAGVNQVNQLQFAIDNPEKLQEDARAKAIADAKAKAKNLESQLGISLGRIVNFSENQGGVPPIYYAKDMGLGMGGGGAQPSLPQGTNEITVDITLTYQIK